MQLRDEWKRRQEVQQRVVEPRDAMTEEMSRVSKLLEGIHQRAVEE